MLSDEEWKAIERIEDFLTTNIIISISNDDTANSEELKAFISKNEYLAIEFIATMFLKHSQEIEHQIEKRANQRNELAILNAKQIEFNKLVNTVNSYKGQFKRQQKEIEELKETLKCTQNSWFEDTQKIEEMKRKEQLIKTYKGNLSENVELICLSKNDFERNISDDYISKDKIKAKIEELNKEFKEYENGQEWEIQDEIRGQIEVLQSLLEKE